MRRHAFLLLLSIICAAANGVDDPKPRAVLRAPFLPGLPLAAVKVRVGNEETIAVLDTGAEAHTVGRWLARKLALRTSRSAQKTHDAAGRAQRVDLLEHPHLSVPGIGELIDRPAMVTDEPEPMEHLGVGCFLSPQALATDQLTVILDFPQHELRLVSAGEIAAAFDGGSARRFSSARLCRDPSARTGYLMFEVAVRINGESALMILDVGADGSQLSRTSAAGRILSALGGGSKGEAMGSTGRYPTWRVPQVQVELGDLKRSVEMTLGPAIGDPHCPADGLLGMDVLKGCRIALTPTQAFGVCE